MTQTPAQATPVYVNGTDAPFIYFDVVPTFGVMGGAVQVECAARTMLPAGPDGVIHTEVLCTAHIRCSPLAAADLITALQKALQMLEQPAGAPSGVAMN